MGLFKRQNIVTRADKISEFTVNTAEYGSAVPEVIGTTRISGNVIYYDDFTAHKHKETTKSGKGGRSKQTNITYTYSVAVILGLCEGEIGGIGKVWRGKEVYTYPHEKIELTCFKGTQNQQPWAYVVGKHPNKAMPYAGLAYMAGVVDMGNSASLPQFNFEVKGKLLSTGDGIDVNPADYIRYVLDKVGLSNVPIEGLDNYRSFCSHADLLISSPPDSNPKQAQAIVNDICKLTNAYFFWSNDRFKIVPAETRTVGGWTPDTTIRYSLTSDDFLPQSNGAMVTYSRKDSAEVYNSFPVEFINRDNGYEKETVNYQLSQDILDHGLRQASTTSAHYFYTKERAVKVAEMLARKAQLERNTYTFKLDWAFCRLEPADIVTITDANIGVENLTVRITSITEDAKGAIVCTAVEVDNVSGEAQYDVHNVDRPYVDFNAPPDDVEQVLILQPPADITADGLELWIGATGGENWGGCTVWVSDDNINYRSIGQLNNSARMGELQANMTADATSCIVSCNDVLISGTQQDAERGNTLCWIGGECLSYTTATMLQDGNYRLDGLIRGQYNTTAITHAAGEQFARLDGTLLRESFRKEDVGKKIWLKFCSYNIFGAMEQSLADVQPYQYTLQAYYIPPVTNVTAYNRYRQQTDGVSRYDIVVKWTPPNLSSYLEGRVWYKTDHGQTVNINDVAGIPVSQLGFQGDWIFGGSGKNQVVIPQAVVGDTYEIAVTTVDKWAASTDPDLAPKVRITVAMKTMVPNTPDGFTLTFGKTATAAWNEVTNTDLMYYEIRRDNAPGAETAGLLARTNGTSANVALNARSGRLYLFARNALGKYSVPAVLSYNKVAPGKPDAPTVKNTMTGFSVAGQGIPADAIGMIVYINDGDAVKTENPVMSYNCEPGIYDVAIAYYDMFGAGERSDTTRTVVKIIIDETNIKDMAISLQKVDKTIQDAVKEAQGISGKVAEIKQTTDSIQATVADDKKELASQITQNADKITSVVTNLGDSAKAKEAYSAIAQMQDDIALRVKSGEIISQINLSKEGVQIDGKLLHVTGDTLFDKNVVVKNMIQAGAVTADKMAVDSLSAITANVGSLKGGTITGTQIVGTNLKNSSGTFTVDDNGNVKGIKISAGTITADVIKQSGFKISAVTGLKGIMRATEGGDDARGWLTIPLPAGYSENECIWGAFPKDASKSTTFAVNGRKVCCYTSRASETNPDSVPIWYWIIGIKGINT